jgi:hypothetical protein
MKKETPSGNVQNGPGQEQRESLCGDDRREALKKMGKYAVYTPPALLLMLTSKKARATGYN